MIYAAAILVIIYISIKLIPYLIGLLTAGAVGIQILRSEMENDTSLTQPKDNSLERRVLTNYKNYKEFQSTFKDFHLLSKRARKKIKNLFDKNNR